MQTATKPKPVVLKQREAVVLELMRAGLTRKEIACKIEAGDGAVKHLIKRIRESGAIRSIEGSRGFEILIEPTGYDILEKIAKKESEEKAIVTEYVPITKHQESYIRGHVDILPRRRIAVGLGIGKTLLNHMIIQLGLGSRNRSGSSG